MLYSKASCGHKILAVGAPGSPVRRRREAMPCDDCMQAAKSAGAVPFQDIGGPHGLPEDQRIDLIGRTVIDKNLTVAFMVDSGPGNEGKAARYIDKLLHKFPGKLQVLDQTPGPVANVTTVRIGPVAGKST